MSIRKLTEEDVRWAQDAAARDDTGDPFTHPKGNPPCPLPSAEILYRRLAASVQLQREEGTLIEPYTTLFLRRLDELWAELSEADQARLRDDGFRAEQPVPTNTETR